MKNFHTLLLFISCAFVGNAQIINFPDPAFKAKLLQADATNYIASTQNPSYYVNAYDNTSSTTLCNGSGFNKIDTNNDGEIQVSEALTIKYLNVSGNFIGSLGAIVNMTGIESFVNLMALKCDYNVISTLNTSSSLINLQYLSCSYNQLSTINISGSTNLLYFNCSQNQLSNLDISSLIYLKDLDCGYNLLTNLNTTNLTNLITLSYSQNQIQNIDTSGLTNLKSLYCDGNQITNLNVSSLINLRQLNYSSNQLPNLNINSLTNLRYLGCSSNQISSLNVNSLTNLIFLYCGGNQLTTLNVDGLINLTDLDFSYNQISNISFGPLQISYLICKHNLLTSINVSNLGNLMQFECDNNQLTNLDVNNLSQLSHFNCSNNQISNLNVSGATYLQYMTCSNNQLTYLNIKNGNNVGVDFSGNPNLHYICADEGLIPTIQSWITQLGYTNCHVNSYCSFTPGGDFYTIQGANHFDANNNGCDANDIILANFKLDITNGTINGSFFVDSTGNYSIPVPAGTHTFTPVFENPSYFNVSPATATVTFPTTASPFVQDFCVTANGVHNDLEVVLIPIIVARPGFDAYYNLVYKNKGNTMQSGTISVTFNNAVLDFVTANPVVTSQTLNNLSWNFSNVAPLTTGEILFTLNVNSPTETPAVNGGDILPFTASINPNATDETPSDNTFAYNQTVVNSFDPNEKECLEGNAIALAKVGDYVHYVIHFQNDGSANAENIVVKDLIDTTKFNIDSLIPESGSANYTTRISNTNQVEFIFQNINLPFAAGTNTGYVAFKIRTNATLTNGDSFSNTANIYFDYNAPIVTNTATTQVQALANQDFEFTNYFTLYPNPAKEVLNIDTKKDINMHSVSVYNILGQLVLVVPNAENTTSINVSSLKTGNYFLKITTDKGAANQKFVKE